jgi:hypothetical protein
VKYYNLILKKDRFYSNFHKKKFLRTYYLLWVGMWALSRNVCTKFSENSTLISSVCKKHGRRLKTPVNSIILTKSEKIEEEVG